MRVMAGCCGRLRLKCLIAAIVVAGAFLVACGCSGALRPTVDDGIGISAGITDYASGAASVVETENVAASVLPRDGLAMDSTNDVALMSDSAIDTVDLASEMPEVTAGRDGSDAPVAADESGVDATAAASPQPTSTLTKQPTITKQPATPTPSQSNQTSASSPQSNQPSTSPSPSPSKQPSTSSTPPPPPSKQPATTAPPSKQPSPSPSPSPVYVPVASVALNHSHLALNRGDSAKLSATVSPANATHKKATYVSSNASVAIVSGDGTLRAVGSGTATITCTADNVSATCSVTVTTNVTSVSVNATESRYAYKVGDHLTFAVHVYPEDATDGTYTLTISGAAHETVSANTISLTESGTVLITAVASDGAKGELSVTVVDLAKFAEEVVRLTNIERQKAGLDPLSRSQLLMSVANARAKETVVVFTHTRPDGQSCFTLYDEFGVEYSSAAENIGHGYNSPAEVVAGWMNSPKHKANILSSNYNLLGAGVAMDKSGSLYWVQSFTG